jgi:hypothetical protein
VLAPIRIPVGLGGGFERFWNDSFDRLGAYVQDLTQAGQEECAEPSPELPLAALTSAERH